jgi:glucose-1-phosphatase
VTSASIDWLVVDLGGVAADFRPERRLVALAQATGLPADVIDERLFRSGLDHDAELGRHTVDSIAIEVIEHLDNRLDRDQLIECWSGAFEPNIELLRTLACVGTRRALFTNNGPLLDLCLAGPLTSVAEAFGFTICSWHIGATKPDPLAFARAADRLATPAERLLLIDDSPANVEAARTAGWHAILHQSVAETTATLAS